MLGSSAPSAAASAAPTRQPAGGFQGLPGLNAGGFFPSRMKQAEAERLEAGGSEADALRAACLRAEAAVAAASAGCFRAEPAARGAAEAALRGARATLAEAVLARVRTFDVCAPLTSHAQVAREKAARRRDADAIRAILDHDAIALISPLGYSPAGELFNLSASEVAEAVAVTGNR